MRIAFYTIGCKLNQFETEFMKEQFEEAGWETVPFKEKADVYIVNTCTVTGQADSKSRQTIRQALKRNPNALVVAVGCYSQVAKEELLKTGASLVLGNPEKGKIVELVEQALKEQNLPRVHVSNINNSFFPMTIENFSGHSRAFIKVQDGCNRRCPYCIVWKARGPSRSAPLELVIKEAQKLADAGFEEIVLTGTHLGCYGEEKGLDLVDLLERLVEIDSLKKIRLSSLEPTEITPQLIEFMKENSKIARHLHIPLQSASNRILRLMNRPYTKEEFEDLVMKLAEALPDVGIGVDVIVGFPTEEEEDFEETYRLIEKLPIYYMHIFPYSPRPNTPAAYMRPQVRPDIKRRRWEIMNQLKDAKKKYFIERFIGKELEGVIENRPASEKGYWSALTENYIPLVVKGQFPQLAGKVKRFKLIQRLDHRAEALLLTWR